LDTSAASVAMLIKKNSSMTFVVKIDNVYVKGVYDECGGVEIQVESNTPTYCSTILAYPTQFAPGLEKWNIPHDSLLATEIYCKMAKSTKNPLVNFKCTS
jgi:hypothetical protein